VNCHVRNKNVINLQSCNLLFTDLLKRKNWHSMRIIKNK
jgi:hypothetical protein